VCVNYKDPDVLRDESEEGRRLGFDGKVGGVRIDFSSSPRL
jgi:citrate lyase beta subunit